MVKKIFLALIPAFACLVFCSCSGTGDIEDSKIVTACAAISEDDKVNYRFYVSIPDGGNESENADTASVPGIYEFTSDNFSGAVAAFKEACGTNLNFSHMSLFITDTSYMDKNYNEDYTHIRREIKITPMLYFCVGAGNADDFFRCISKEYSGNPQKLTAAFFGKKNAYLSCTATELMFARENKYYTGVLPVVEIREENEVLIPGFKGAYVYNVNAGTFYIAEDEYHTYKTAKKLLYKSGDLYSIEIDGDKIKATFDAGLKDREKMIQFSNKYAHLGFDIFNCIYYAKKKFLTYRAYENFVNGFYIQNLSYTGGD